MQLLVFRKLPDIDNQPTGQTKVPDLWLLIKVENALLKFKDVFRDENCFA